MNATVNICKVSNDIELPMTCKVCNNFPDNMRPNSIYEFNCNVRDITTYTNIFEDAEFDIPTNDLKDHRHNY